MRHTQEVSLIDRGVQKTFLITELSASEAEDWAVRLFLALTNEGVVVPDDIEEQGFAGVAQLGFGALGKIPYEKAKPLLDIMMKCVKVAVVVNGQKIIRDLVEEDIEDVKNRFLLRKAVLFLHLDFSSAVEN